MNAELWFPGSMMSINSGNEVSQFVVRKISKSSIYTTNLRNGKAFEFSKEELDQLLENDKVTFLSARKDFGELCFDDLSLKEQADTSRKYRYVSRIISNDVAFFSDKQLSPIAQSVAEELQEQPPHWKSLYNWYKEYEEAGFKYRGLFPKNRYKVTDHFRTPVSSLNKPLS